MGHEGDRAIADRRTHIGVTPPATRSHLNGGTDLRQAKGRAEEKGLDAFRGSEPSTEARTLASLRSTARNATAVHGREPYDQRARACAIPAGSWSAGHVLYRLQCDKLVASSRNPDLAGAIGARV